MMNGPVLSRRALLKSAAAAAAVTWGRVVPGGVAAADAKTVTGGASRPVSYTHLTLPTNREV